MKLVYTLCSLVLFCTGSTYAQNITTVAGGWGDHGPASSSVLVKPYATAVDKWGNVYISDKGHNIVRKVDTFGTITTYAGTGGTIAGPYEENIPATNANITVAGIAVDTSGILFIATNSGLKKVDLAGNISTHSVQSSNYGIGIDKQGNIYCAAGSKVMQISPAGVSTVFAGSTYGFDGDWGAATAAKLSGVRGVCTDKTGNVYIVDRDINKRIRKVMWGSLITTIAGNGTIGCTGNGGYATLAAMDGIEGIGCDTFGNIYVTDEWCNVRKIDTSGIITEVAAGTLNTPMGVTADNRGNIYICENTRVRKVDASGVVSTFAGGGGTGDGGMAIAGLLVNPTGLCYDSTQNLYIADRSANTVRKVNAAGVITTFAGNGTAGYSGDGGPATAAQLWLPGSIATDKKGNLFICDRGNNRIRKVNSAGIITTYAGNGTAAYAGDGGPATAASLSSPAGIAIDKTGNLYIADLNNLRIRKVDTFGNITTVAGNGLLGATGDGGPATAAKISKPIAVAIDTAGNLFIADRDNFKVRKVDAAGIIWTYAGIGLYGTHGDSSHALTCALGNLHGISIAVNGDLLVVDDNSIRRIDSFQYIWHVAGNGTNGFRGDNVPAFNAAINTGTASDYYTTGIASDTAGNLLFTDQYNARVRKIYNATISIVASAYTVCPGNTASFLSTTMLAPGFNPVYHWVQNGVSVGTNFPNYAATSINDNDNIYCYITDGATGPVIATSNSIIMYTSTYLTPSVTVAINTDTIVCAGTNVEFVPIPVYGGTAPTYEWYKNSLFTAVGPTFITAPTRGEKVYCKMTSNHTCLTAYTVTSNTKTFDVLGTNERVLSIASNGGDTVCRWLKVKCRISELHAAGVSFKWYKNGAVVSTDTVYSFYPATGDAVRCMISGSNLPCSGLDTAGSNTLRFNVRDQSISFIYDRGPRVCGATPITCTATAVNAGSEIRWQHNQMPAGTGSIYTFVPGASDKVACYADFPGCGTFSSGHVEFSSIATPTVTISHDEGATILRGTKVTFTATATGDYNSFEWYHNGKLVAGANTAEYATDEIGLRDSVRCVVRSTDSCAFVASSATLLINTFHRFRLYPNPSNGNFAISGDDENANSNDVHIAIYSQDGKLVYDQQSAFRNVAFFEPLQLKNLLTPGIYIVTVTYNGERQKMLLSIVP
jgi:hypothetical protein